jgi:ribosomal protein L14E/L6E/L27E
VDEVVMPQLGQIVKVLRGKGFNKFAAIVGIVDQRFVLIADGDKRKIDQPKKKNLLHLEPMNFVSSEIVNSIEESGRVTNRKLRYAISKFIEQRDPNV